MRVAGDAFTCAPLDALHPLLARYLHTTVPQTAHYDEAVRCYRFRKNGAEFTCGGIHTTLRAIFYPHYKDNRSRRDKSVKIKGSSKAQGIRVDREIAAAVEKRGKKLHPMSAGLLEYWRERGEVLQAAQVPVQLTMDRPKMTQADLITMDPSGRLILYEVPPLPPSPSPSLPPQIKTGAPVGFHVTQGAFQVHSVAHVECTKKNIWQLQLAYTRMALEASGVPIAESHVIQIYDKREEGLRIVLHSAPAWTAHLPPNPKNAPPPKRKVLSLKKRVGKPPPLKGRPKSFFG